MVRNRYLVEQIIVKLREAEVLEAKEKSWRYCQGYWYA